MAKDSYWFKHDSTSGRGRRIRKIQFIHGHWGKGIYWDVIEYLREQEGYKSASDEFTLKMICDLIGCKDEAKFLSWFNDCVKEGLLISDGKCFFSDRLITNMKTWEDSKENGKKGGNPAFKKGAKNPYYDNKDKPKDNPPHNPTNKGRDKHKSRVDKKREEYICTHPLQITVKEKLPNVFKLKDQLTVEQCTSLISNYSKELIWEKLQAMENKPDLTKKYKSVYLTLNNWCRMKQEETPAPTNKKETLAERSARLTAENHP